MNARRGNLIFVLIVLSIVCTYGSSRINGDHGLPVCCGICNQEEDKCLDAKDRVCAISILNDREDTLIYKVNSFSGIILTDWKIQLISTNTTTKFPSSIKLDKDTSVMLRIRMNDDAGCIPITMNYGSSFECSCVLYTTFQKDGLPQKFTAIHQSTAVPSYASKMTSFVEKANRATSETIEVSTISTIEGNNSNGDILRLNNTFLLPDENKDLIIVVTVVVLYAVTICVIGLLIVLKRRFTNRKRDALQVSQDDLKNDTSKEEVPISSIFGIKDNILYISADDFYPERSHYAEISSSGLKIYDDLEDDIQITEEMESFEKEVAETLAELDYVSEMHDKNPVSEYEDQFPVYAVVNKIRRQTNV